MNAESHTSQQQSPGNVSQQAATFKEPRPVRTPARSDHSHSHRKSPSSHRRQNYPQIIQESTCEPSKHAYRSGRPEQTRDQNSHTKDVDRLGGRGFEWRGTGQEGWPSPAPTQLGSHIQNYHQMMEKGAYPTYESPIVHGKLPQPNGLPVHAPAHQNQGEELKEVVNQEHLRVYQNKSPLNKNSHDLAQTSYEQGSTTVGGASRNWVHQTPHVKQETNIKGIESPNEDPAQMFASSAGCNYYHPYGPGGYPYPPSSYYYGPQGVPSSYNSHEYASRGYPSGPPHMVSPHRRGGPIYQPVYYDQPHMGQPHHPTAAAYPAHVSHGHYMNAYYPPPSAYYDAGAGGPKYHGGVPRSQHYPEYSHEGDYHRYGPYLHPYQVVHPAMDSSPSHLVPIAMRSPHMPHPHHNTLSVHKSASKSKRRSGDQKQQSMERPGCNSGNQGGGPGRARIAQLNPRQLNFNDASVDSDRNRICFEEEEQDREDAPYQEPDQQTNNNPESVQDNDEDRFEVVKIKLNKAQNDQKLRSEQVAKRQVRANYTAQTQKHRLLTDNSLIEQPFECVEDMDGVEPQPMTTKASLKRTNQTGTNGQSAVRRDELPSLISIKSSNVASQQRKNEETPVSRPRRSSDGSMHQSGGVQRPRETDNCPQDQLIPDPIKMLKIEAKPVSTQGLLLRDDHSNKTSEAVSQVAQSLKSAALIATNPKRRGYMYNEESGQMERVIRKRKRKTANQLEELQGAFELDPHWTKEMLLDISMKTFLTEAQVYKWGWDQKRKKYGVQEAERMRQYENILDQQAAAARKEKSQKTNSNDCSTKVQIKKRVPEQTPEQASNDASALADRDHLNMVNFEPLQSHNESQVKMLASAEQAQDSSNLKNSVQVSAFGDAHTRQQMTVQKPSNGLNSDHLQKSATTNTQTIRVSLNSVHHYTPVNKNGGVSDVDDLSDKFTPDNSTTAQLKKLQNIDGVSSLKSSRRNKLLTKDQAKIRKVLPPAQHQVAVEQIIEQVQIKKQPSTMQQQQTQQSQPVVPRKTRQQVTIEKQEALSSIGSSKQEPSGETGRRSKRTVVRKKDPSVAVCSLD